MAIPGDLRVSNTQFDAAIGLLGQYVKIPTVSNTGSPDYNMGALEAGAAFASSQLKELGFEVETVQIQGSPPFVLAERVQHVAKPTLLLYAHYDVQPVDRDKWQSNPFEMELRNGRLYGRGASDDKAGIIAILTALNVYKQANRELPVNVRILFEGEEEFGSSHMPALLEQRAERLRANALIVLDGLNRTVDTGTLTTSTRGIVNLQLSVKALDKPIHSGIGCLAPDPAQALAALIHSLRDPRAIPGFMDDAEALGDEERAFLRKNSASVDAYAKENGIVPGAQLRGDSSHSIDERIVAEPSISIVNMTCGKPRGGNSIQDVASCQVGIRVTAGQDPDRVGKVVMEHLRRQIAMYNLPVDVHQEESAWAWKANIALPYSSAYLQALAANFPQTSGMPLGGALPLLRIFQRAFPQMEMVVPGVEDPDTAAHSHNESQDVQLFRRQIDTLISFIGRAGSLPL